MEALLNAETPIRALFADGGIWPILFFWLFIVLVGRAARKKKAGKGEAGTGTGAAPQQTGLLAELKRAMEELKAAEAAQRGAVSGAPPEATQQERRARLEQQKQLAALKRAQRGGRDVPARLTLPDAEEMSSEFVEAGSNDARDYDDEAEQIVKARHAAAERGGREEFVERGFSEEQRLRRASRSDEAIGSRAEHGAWHDAIGATPPPAAPVAVKGPLARFGDGSKKSAVVLSEILGRPVGDRPQDG